ncbi:MAG: hypothetical protein EBY52_06210, partial [Actinobacteria bacterium]|nr:hypothetical protein [Actinomycetota bacterium]
SISPQNFSVDMELVRTNHRGAVFGTSIHPAASDSVSDQRLRLRQITDEVMFEIRALTGQDYVNEYAGKTPLAAAQAPHTTGSPEMPERRSSADVLKPVPA